jgi:transposase-like protein
LRLSTTTGRHVRPTLRRVSKDAPRSLRINDKTLNDWIIKHSKTKRVTQARTEEHKQLDAVNRRIHELESENKFPRKVAAFFAGSLC